MWFLSLRLDIISLIWSNLFGMLSSEIFFEFLYFYFSLEFFQWSYLFVKLYFPTSFAHIQVSVFTIFIQTFLSSQIYNL